MKKFPKNKPGSRQKIREITQVRSEYTSARLICSNLEHRLAGTRFCRHPGYVSPEIDYATSDSSVFTTSVRDYDVRYLDRVPLQTALKHIELIHRARNGNQLAAQELKQRTRDTYQRISSRFAGRALAENEYVIPYTTPKTFSEAQISHKGAILLDLSRRGFATADFNLLAADAYKLPGADLERCVLDAVRNLEILSGRQLGNPDNPLLIAMRSALPEYIPGLMPTYLNVGLTPEVLPGLPRRYGEDGAARIRLNNRKTLLEALDPLSFLDIEKEIRPDLRLEENLALASRIEEIIGRQNPRLLADAFAQIMFFLSKTYQYYDSHLDVLRNFAVRETYYPAVIFQRMVCSVIDRESYPGVLYSHHPRLGTGVFLQFARTAFGEDLMTGRLQPEERRFRDRKEAKAEFPAVYHFWDRLAQLEDIFRGPIMVEFTGVHGTFTILQVNAAEMSGAGMLTAVMGMHRAGRIPVERVRDLIKPYHVRQIESDAIDPRSLHTLEPFGRGVAVLPRSAVTGQIFFSAARAQQVREERGGTNVILVKERFTPLDAIDMQKVSGICSLSPAAIHVVTTAQNLGIPALLNLEECGIRIDPNGRTLVNSKRKEICEGDWITISSRFKTLYAGKAVYAPARLLRFMAGEAVELTPAERARFERLACCYREYHQILESVDASDFESLQDLGHAIRYGRLRADPARAVDFVNPCFDLHEGRLSRRLLESTLGTHLINKTAYERLTDDRKIRLLKTTVALCLEKGVSGYQAGAFVIGSLVEPNSPVVFWEHFCAREVAVLINEWVLHQKYLHVLDDVGERRISRAKDVILSQGLGALSIPRGAVSGFITLKLSRVDLHEVRRMLAETCDPQTASVLDLLQRPFSEFFDFSDPRSLANLRRICEINSIPLPRPDDV
jgi:hypothetical protein